MNRMFRVKTVLGMTSPDEMDLLGVLASQKWLMWSQRIFHLRAFFIFTVPAVFSMSEKLFVFFGRIVSVIYFLNFCGLRDLNRPLKPISL